MGNARWVAWSMGLVAIVLTACATPAAVSSPGAAGPISSPREATSAGPTSDAAPPSPSVSVTFRSAAPPATSTTADETPRCPARLALTGEGVPKPPATVPATRMLPDGAVRSALMCVYVGTNMDSDAGLPLSRRTSLQGDLDAMAAELRWLPPEVPGQQHACAAVGGQQINFLVAVRFTDGRTSWIGTADDPDSCVGTAGSVTSASTTGPRFLAAMKAGRWTPPAASDDGSCPSGARFGQQDQMVPPGAVGVRICLYIGNKTTRVDVSSGFAELVTSLNDRPTRPSTSSCSLPTPPTGATEAPDHPLYRLVFRYREGPSVGVNVSPDCTPSIDNSALQAADSRSVVPLLTALLASHH